MNRSLTYKEKATLKQKIFNFTGQSLGKKKKKKKKSWIYSDCQHSVLTIDGRNAIDSTILQEFSNPQRVCETGIMKIGYALSALSKHKPKGL